MKNSSAILFLSLLFLSFGIASCKKATTESIQPSLIVGKWYIHHIYLRSYYNQSFIADSTLRNDPHPENFVQFNSDGTLLYKFNKASADAGTYQVHGPDSVYASIGNQPYRWQIDLLISTNFNIQTTNKNVPFPGYQLETYQSFVRN